MILVRRTLVVASLALLTALAAVGVIQTARPAAASPVSPGAVGQVAADAPAAPLAAAGTAVDPDLAAGIDAILAADTTPGSTARAAARGQLRRLAAWGRLVHATVVVDLKKGGLTTVQLDHGTIAAVSATSLTVKEAGGASVTVALGGGSRVRRDGAKSAIGDLKTGDEVFVMSKVESGGTNAYLVVVPRG